MTACVNVTRWRKSQAVMILRHVSCYDSLEIGESTKGSLISHGTVHFKHFFGDLLPLIYIYICSHSAGESSLFIAQVKIFAAIQQCHLSGR